MQKYIYIVVLFSWPILFSGCQDLVVTSDTFAYRGTGVFLSSRCPLDIYGSYEKDHYIQSDSTVLPSIYPVHLDGAGTFLFHGIGRSRRGSETVQQWEGGPLLVLIKGPCIQTYLASFSIDDLKALNQNKAGEWILPPITLQPIQAAQ